MNWFSRIFSSRQISADLSAELRSHLAEKIDALVASGLSRREAELAARRQFGNSTLLEQRSRDIWSLPTLESFLADIRFALRMFRRNFGFTVAAILVLALGIGANTTLFSAFNAVALKPLPVRDSRSVVRLVRSFANGRQGTVQFLYSYPEYLAYRDHNSVFASLVAVSLAHSFSAAIPSPGASVSQSLPEPATLYGQFVSADYFAGLGIDPSLGRTFSPEENSAPGAHPVVVLSYPCWQRRFGADSQVVGHVIHLNQYAFTVVGVAPREFIGTANPPEVPDFWTPLAMEPQLLPGQDWLNQFNNDQVQLLGRLAPGTSATKAAAAMQTLALNVEASQILPDASSRTTALTLQRATYFGETSDPRFRAFVALLMVVVSAVLLVACANLANMSMARSANRQREIGVRLALGAGRGRLIRQLLTESILLALLGGAVGLLFSLWASRLLWLSVSELIERMFTMDPSLIRLAPDFPVFSYAFAVSVFTGLGFGLLPALHFSRSLPMGSLRDDGSVFGKRFSHSRLRNAMVIAQVAVSLALLVTSGLLVRGMLRSQTTDPGFDAQNVFGPFGLQFDNDPAKANAIARRVLERLRNSPIVESIGVAERVPLLSTWSSGVLIEGTGLNSPDLLANSFANSVSRGYFSALGIPILRGRNFSGNEDVIGSPVAIVSESTARSLWHGQDPIGRRLKFDVRIGPGAPLWKEFEVIGVAQDAHTASLTRVDPALLYFPLNADHLFADALFLRLPDGSEKTQRQLRAEAEFAAGRTLPGFRLVSYADGPVRVQRLMPRTFAFFASVLACLAVTLAAVGVYGIVAFSVSQRTREIGVRMAFGARPAEVLKLMVLQGMWPVFIGAIAGLVISVGISGILRAILTIPGGLDLLFGVSSFDPLTFGALTSLLALIALLASYVPARRATRVDPIIALRHE